MSEDVRFEFGFACEADFGKMPKQERAYSCEECGREVFELSEHTTDEVALLTSGPSPACVRATFAPDGSVVTRLDREGTPRKVWAALAGVAAVAAGVGLPAMAADASHGDLSVTLRGRPEIVSATVRGNGVRQQIALKAQPFAPDSSYGSVSLSPGSYRLTLISKTGSRERPLDVVVEAGQVTSYDGHGFRTFRYIPPPPTAGVPLPQLREPPPKPDQEQPATASPVKSAKSSPSPP